MQFSTDKVNPKPHTGLVTLADLQAPKSCLPRFVLNKSLHRHSTHPMQYTHTRLRYAHKQMLQILSYLLAQITALCSTTVIRWQQFDTSDSNHKRVKISELLWTTQFSGKHMQVEETRGDVIWHPRKTLWSFSGSAKPQRKLHYKENAA